MNLSPLGLDVAHRDELDPGEFLVDPGVVAPEASYADDGCSYHIGE